MGLIDKIKNALFEVEYVEVDEPPKKEKKSKSQENPIEENNLEKPIAKKIVLPGKREEKIEKIQEEELIDHDFEARPKDETIKESSNSSFRFMDDSDFEVEEEPKIIEKIDEVEVLSDQHENNVIKEEVLSPPKETISREEYHTSYSGVSPIQNLEPYSSTTSINYKVKERESRPYGMDPSYRVSIREYGSYETKDEKGNFKPSPIISPIYGILDKNYKKEDVVPKKEVRITTNYTRTNVNVDDIRNKAYGVKTSKNEKTAEELVEETEDENLLVDLSDEKEKPEVKEITVGDAMEYFQDLGLEYNVDYVDASNKNNTRRKPDDLEKDIENNLSKEEVSPVVEKSTSDVSHKPSNEDNSKVIEVMDEAEQESVVNDEDNLFDLIDSMYKEDH